MARAAGLLAVLAAGCAGSSLHLALPGFGPGGCDDLVLPGPPKAASAAALDTLRGMNLFVSCGRDGEAVRVTSVTPSGRKFTLWFRPKKGDKGEQTAVRIEWAKEADEAFWAQVQVALAAGPSAGPGGPRAQ
jgi:hypothetical protein